MEDQSTSDHAAHGTTRRDFVKASSTAVVGALGFPALAFGHAGSKVRTPSPSGGDTALATNGFLSSILPLADQAALREINIRLTRMAIEQCEAGGGAANQIAFGTLVCLALGEYAAHDVSPDDLLALSRDFDVVFPWSLAYGNVRTPFNYRFVKLPLAIAFPRAVEDVVFWVNFVRDHEFSVSIRSGNNSYEGFSSSNEIIIDLTFLRLKHQGNLEAQFLIDAKAGLVHTAPGVRLGVLYTRLAERGFALAGGQCAPVCVGGLIGTGGIGFATRDFGFAADQLVEVQWVLADGRVVVANATNQFADLYRASKGAGAGGLGVMTRLTLRLVPAVPVLFYTVVFDPDDAAVVTAAWQNLAATAPKALSSLVSFTASKDDASVFAANGTYRVESGTVAAATAALTAVLHTQWLDLLPPPLNLTPIVIEEMTTAEAATTVASLVPMPTFNQWKLKSIFTFHSLTAADLQPVFDYLKTHVPSDDPTKAVGYFNAWLCGGRSNEIDPGSAVMPAREGTVVWVHSGAQWNDQSEEPQALAFVDGMWAILDSILQSSTGLYGIPDLQFGSQLTNPPNFDYARAYWSSPTHDFVPFLIGVKNTYDPTDLFRFAQSIPLSLGGS